MSGWSLLALCVFIGGGAIYRMIRPDVQLISDTVIQYFIVGVFAEIFGVVAIIAKQVWSE